MELVSAMVLELVCVVLDLWFILFHSWLKT